MPRVFVHTYRAHNNDWENDYYDFSRVPNKAELIALSSKSPWFQVELVVHIPFEEDLAAEIYAVEVDREKVKMRKLNIKPAIEFE
ncbi:MULTISPECIES: hypothetical protein [Paenibacillus]|uniref:hypothetical protein n=1 Tax=Paenibacillus TaxID=44249 RepID=UPI0007864EC0|nr:MULTISPECIES: hypothetical protein [Paenibacillus]MEC0124163.1 hypothetical protein [Paenibacillus pabuli]